MKAIDAGKLIVGTEYYDAEGDEGIKLTFVKKEGNAIYMKDNNESGEYERGSNGLIGFDCTWCGDWYLPENE